MRWILVAAVLAIGAPYVRCTSVRELVDWLDLRFPRLALYPH